MNKTFLFPERFSHRLQQKLHLQLVHLSCNSKKKYYETDQFNFIICNVIQKYVAINYPIVYFYNRKFVIKDS